jgi:hypothetical protein
MTLHPVHSHDSPCDPDSPSFVKASTAMREPDPAQLDLPLTFTRLHRRRLRRRRGKPRLQRYTMGMRLPDGRHRKVVVVQCPMTRKVLSCDIDLEPAS